MFQSTWPQLNISPSSKFSYSYFAWQHPFYSCDLFTFDTSYIFDKTIRAVRTKDMAVDQNERALGPYMEAYCLTAHLLIQLFTSNNTFNCLTTT